MYLCWLRLIRPNALPNQHLLRHFRLHNLSTDDKGDVEAVLRIHGAQLGRDGQ